MSAPVYTTISHICIYNKMEGPLDVSRIRPLVHVLCVTLLLTIPIMQGVFDGIHTNTSPDHYAEKAWPVLKDWAPWLVIMPANTVVNLCYIVVGVYWLLATKILVKAQTRRGKAASTDLTGHDVYMMYAFCWISIIYGPVQMARILMLKHRLAVLDQWYTLPGFAWVLAWALYHLRGWSVSRVIAVIGISTLSYCLTLLHPLGFDFALACHIIVIVKYCIDVQQQYGTAASRLSFVKALLACSGFVILKLADRHLPTFHPLFNHLSGHFWSKLCDALQIYYVAEFFFIITLERTRVKRE